MIKIRPLEWLRILGVFVVMESNDDRNLEAINASVGRLVWVRRRNGSWWPGQTLVHDQVPDNSLVAPKVGTPIKLLGRDDVSV